MSEKNDNQWWEFYGVRYAQGTVFGALIVYFLFSQSPLLKGMLFIPSEPKDFGMPQLILMAIYGLVYCYISSAPILILHAARGLLFPSATNPNPKKWRKTRIFALTIPALITSAFFYISSEGDKTLNAGVIFIYVEIIALQVVGLWSVLWSFWPEVFEYYKTIIRKRQEYETTGYIESYRHIREHGNSFLIVVFQFVLAAPIYVFVSSSKTLGKETIANLVLIILIWIFPASIIWLFGNKLENSLQNLPSSTSEAP